MDESALRALLEEVRAGHVSSDDAVARLRDMPYENLGFARIDHHRNLRTGFPEVIYCPGKTTEQIVAIAERLASKSHKVLATRIGDEAAQAMAARFPGAELRTPARIMVMPGEAPAPEPSDASRYVLVVCAGTADIPVAEEAAVTAAEMGSRVERLFDVGVAGLHRLLDQMPLLTGAAAIVVVAGMEGALASVVGGLVRSPVVAVPTSVGYGASFGGVSALLTMLNSCAAGVAVMNIDNGFGAGYFAHVVVRVAST